MRQGFLEKVRNFFVLEEDESLQDTLQDKPSWKGKLVSLTSRPNAIVIIEPETLGDAEQIGDHLKNRAAILVNLQGLEPQQATRVLDFACGIAYALNGTTQKISEGIFLFAPPNVTVIPAHLKSGALDKGKSALLDRIPG